MSEATTETTIETQATEQATTETTETTKKQRKAKAKASEPKAAKKATASQSEALYSEPGHAHFSINRDALLAGVASASLAVDKKASMPVLHNLLIEAQSEGIFASAMGSSFCIKSACSADRLHEEGRITINAARLLGILKTLPTDSEVTIKCDEAGAVLVCGSAKFSIPTLDAGMYPELGLDAVLPTAATLDKEVLLEAIDKGTYAHSDDAGRDAFACGLLVFNGGFLDAVSTDGHRLARHKRAIEGHDGETKDTLLVPGSALSAIKGLLTSDRSGLPVQIQATASQSRFTIGADILQCSLSASKFPNYEAVIPKDCDKIAVIDRAKLIQASKLVRIMAESTFHGVYYEFSDNTLTLKSRNSNNETAQMTMEIEYSAPKLSMIFNADYVVEALSKLEGNEIRWSLKSETGGTKVESLNDAATVTVLMPMKV